jgi:hypothetical protein
LLPVRGDLLERDACSGDAREAVQDGLRAGIGRTALETRGAEAENENALLAVIELERHLERRARIEACADAVRKLHAPHRGRVAQRAIAPDELGAVAGHGACRVIDVEKRDLGCEFSVVGVACANRTAGRLYFGDHVHRRLRSRIAEHPLDVTGR